MNILTTIISGFICYIIFEVVFRTLVLRYFAGKQSLSCRLLQPNCYLILSPGYWSAGNCKSATYGVPNRKVLLTKLIDSYNCWNLVLSCLILLIALWMRENGEFSLTFTAAFVASRYISRSVEITIAFGKDILSPTIRSSLGNHQRMKLAIRSYFEIFIYSAAFHVCFQTCYCDMYAPILNSLYVGTLTGVHEAAQALTSEFWVFFQVFATTSLVVLSIAGYLGKVKDEYARKKAD